MPPKKKWSSSCESGSAMQEIAVRTAERRPVYSLYQVQQLQLTRAVQRHHLLHMSDMTDL